MATAKPVRSRSRIKAAKIDLEFARCFLRADARDFAAARSKEERGAGETLERSAIRFAEALAELRQAEGA